MLWTRIGTNNIDVYAITAVPRHPDDCVGCLGDGACWVCLGTGVLTPERTGPTCHRCAGSGKCCDYRTAAVNSRA